MICTNEDTKLINEIMRDFTNITKIAAIFVNNRGKVLSQEYNFSPFLQGVRRNPAYAKTLQSMRLIWWTRCYKRTIFLPIPLSSWDS